MQTYIYRCRWQILPPWETGKQSMISFKFRTNEPNGLILLSSGTKPGNVSISFAIRSINCLYSTSFFNFRRISLLWNCWMGTFTFTLIWARALPRCVRHDDASMTAVGMNWFWGVRVANARCLSMANGMISVRQVMPHNSNWTPQSIWAELDHSPITLIGRLLCGQLRWDRATLVAWEI